jgi:phosphate transport system substrate-binding protein
MNRFSFILVLTFFVAVLFTNCNNEPEINLTSSYISELTIDNFPRMDNSTSSYPLNVIIFCKLFDIDYKWVNEGNIDMWNVKPLISGNNKKKFDKLIKNSQTHGSFINLITKDTDLILAARTMSDHEKKYANEAGITLIETPIALDAFIFIVNPDNLVEFLTITQIQDIYLRNITNWNEFGLDSMEIRPYVRNINSGSQELMDLLVMKDLDYYYQFQYSPEFNIIGSMVPTFERVSTERNSISYSLWFFKEYMIRKENFTKTISVNGIFPNKETIANNKETIGNNTYPLVSEVYAVIRSDTDKTSMTYKVYEWLQTEAGKLAINESGYIPY